MSTKEEINNIPDWHEIEKASLLAMLEAADGDPREACKLIGWSYNFFCSEMFLHGLCPPIEIKKGQKIIRSFNNTDEYHITDSNAKCIPLEIAQLIPPEVHAVVIPLEIASEVIGSWPQTETRMYSDLWTATQVESEDAVIYVFNSSYMFPNSIDTIRRKT